MAASLKKVSLTDFVQEPNTCFSAATSGDLIQITSGDQEAYLIGFELFQFITDCLTRYEMLITK